MVYGFNPRGVDELRDSASLGRLSAVAEDFAKFIHEVHKDVKAKLEKSTLHYKEVADAKRREKLYEVGDLVLEHL